MTDAALPINLALQGGGSHGALAWGVLDRLLQEPRLRIAEISGTSAGAMNAVVLAHGMEKGGPEAAREALAGFWKAVSDAARYSPMQPTIWDRMKGDFSLDRSPPYLMAETLSRMFSPYELNPFDVNPLRDLVQESVDFDAINRSTKLRVHLNATNVRTGHARIFSNGEITCDTVLASACLPLMYRAVEIEGEAYWDGGYSANPALTPLIIDSEVVDVLIVQLNPMRREKLPRNAREIINRINEISFNTSLMKELRALDSLSRLVDKGVVEMNGGIHLRLHMIHGEEDLQDLSSSSKMNADWAYLQHLFNCGTAWAEDWLQNHLDDVGKRPSFYVEEHFGRERPKVPR
ncbi:patatin-like phospholipase family protein [Paracoccus sp. PAR01]|uniref:patatin-like phospholipase family protein n=1 Tax=Paracoccus sp. PAR01 TaxID=2769282 RepID=UPI0017810ED9|nr:patatin-like phospholipase family protein [Paracoccus sp. PAR01]MBD9528775.1 patatin-like phospholipase family protein [Paracoccus sp. PAR01]